MLTLQYSFSVQVSPECQSSADCPPSDICYQGSCQNACRFQSCGRNADCFGENHVAQCVCIPGTSGNPTVECLPCKEQLINLHGNLMHASLIFFSAKLNSEPSLAAGCSNDDDCPDYSACRNRKCINPCAEDKPCAPLASCKVHNHQVLCACPDGYVGSPEISCRPRKYY